VHVEVTVCLPRETQTIPLVRSIVTSPLKQLGVSPPCVNDIRLALSEACTNVIEHAVADDEYEVCLHVRRDQCVISVTNTVQGFDTAQLRSGMPDRSLLRGRGVPIMSAVMDHVDVNSAPSQGTTVRLVKALTVLPGGPLDRLSRSEPLRTRPSQIHPPPLVKPTRAV
jgi:serine/threonine-protein kinase RsbW